MGTMMRVTTHFKKSEFDSRDGVKYPDRWVNSRLKPLCKALEIIRKEFDGRPISITSGFRSAVHNKRVGGVKKSQHLYGRAADIRVKGINAREVARVVRQLIKDGMIPSGGVGSYSSFCHYDQRSYNARWRGR